MNNPKEKMSNFELMKIVSMILIVFWHFIHNTNLLDKTTGFLHFLLIIVWFLAIVHVNSFVLAMGYFQSEKNFRFNRVLALNNAAWFYKIFFLILFTILGIEVTSVEKLELISPITLYNQYWFLSTYLIVYCISPFLNITIKNISKKNFQKLIFALFIIISILTTITGQRIYSTNFGHSVFTFVLLYYIGAYIKKYPIEDNYYFRNISIELRKLILVLLFVFIGIFNALLFHYGEELIMSNNELLKYIGNNIINLKLGFDNPLVIIQATTFFLYFYSLNLKSKIINLIASCSFGVYLIHDNILVRTQLLYSSFFDFSFKYSISHVFLRILLSTIVVFTVCIVIEYIRINIFKFLSKQKLFIKAKEKMKIWISSIGINMNW